VRTAKTGKVDAFVAKFDSTGTRWATNLLRSSSVPQGRCAGGIALTGGTSPTLYVTGSTESNNLVEGFPRRMPSARSTAGVATPSSFRWTRRLNNVSSLLFCTYIGGNKTDRGSAVAVNSTGSAVVAG